MCKGFAYYFLFNHLSRCHLGLRIETHGNVQKFFVEEWDTSFYTPSGKALVGTQAVVKIQLGDFAYGLFMESTGVRCFMEVEITAEYLVRSFTAKYHFDSHRLDDTCQQIHRCRGTYGSHIVSLDKIDYIT